MSKNCRVIAAALLLLCGWFSDVALGSRTIVQPGSPYVVDVWGTQEELPGSSVISVIQTRDDYLWLATLYGLVRFDGVKFTSFDEANTPEISSIRIVHLFEDSRSNLWVGTEGAGVDLIDRNGRIQNVQVQAGDPRDLHVVSACEDSNGTVWLLMKDGRLCRYEEGKLQFLPGGFKAIMTEKTGQLWLGTDRGVFSIVKAPPGSAALAVGSSPIPVTQRLDFLLASSQGGEWVFADGQVQKWKDNQRVLDWTYPWGNKPVTAACEDKEGNLIVGTYGDGIYWYNAEGRATHLSVELSHPYIQSLVIDREGSLWVGTDGGGLDRVKPRNFRVLAESAGNTVQSVCPDQQGGLWIGYHGPTIQYRKEGQVSAFNLPFNSEFIPSVSAVFADRAGRVLVGASSLAGNHLFELHEGKFQPGTLDIRSDIDAIFEDRQGQIWIGTMGGLVLWSGTNSRLFSTGDGLPSADVRAIADDAEGNLWIGTGGGLAKLSGGRITAFRKKDGLPSEDISSLLIDAEGILWMGTRGSGLVRFYKNQWTHYTTTDGLTGNSIGYLIDDQHGNLWMSSNAGLMKASKSSLNAVAANPTNSVACRGYVESDGLPTRECTEGSQPAASLGSDGTIWFPTTRGLVYVDPASLRINSFQPPVVIESVAIGEHQQKFNPLRGRPSDAVIPPGELRLEIQYTSLNLGAAEQTVFRYRLEGYEQNWHRAGRTREASYPKLPPGDYHFQVTAANEDGIWNANPVFLAIRVQPPFWQTWWFQTSTVIFLLGAIVGIVHYFSTQKLQRQLAVLKQQEMLEGERARIARDLHDQLGANLTQVALLAELAESDKNIPAEVEDHAQQISQTARETTKALDEIVWAVNPLNDTLEGLVNYSARYAQEYFALAGLRYRVDMPTQLPVVELPPEVRHNVFLAFKESVNNVVKHAQATEVHTRLRLDNSSFTMEIEDNGRGPGDADKKSGRNGLRNMRKRMEDVGGSFSMSPAAGQGTIVRLVTPIKNH